MNSPSSYRLPASSPLETLVRRTSSRKAVRPPEAISVPPQPSGPQNVIAYADEGSLTPPRQPRRPPSSPLLHTQFRSSTATELSYANSSFRDSSQDASGARYGGQRSQNDDASIYSSVTFPRNSARDTYDPYHIYEEYEQNDHGTAQQPDQPDAVPALVVSTPVEGHHSHNSSVTSLQSGRAPSLMPANANFSRPVRPPATSLRPPIDRSDSKQQVLQRNAYRAHSTASPSSLRPGMLSPAPSGAPSTLDRSRSTGDIRAAAQPFSPSAPSSLSASIPGPSKVSSRTLSPTPPTSANGLTSPTDPHARPGNQSPVSLYSSYSYYPYEGAIPSPTTPKTPDITVTPAARPEPAQSPSMPMPDEAQLTDGSKPIPGTPQYYLLEGIEHHENNRLKESAQCFERSAKENGGCGAGMLMWGLSQRHGWGCEKNEKSGFQWLRKAAEIALDDLQVIQDGEQRNAIKSEMVVAIYEVGQCFFQGWGVHKDQKMAVDYFRTAAKLGDADAQQDLAFCLANGKGCKKDKKEAAKWYRAAVAQGASDVGLAWIYKEKYK